MYLDADVKIPLLLSITNSIAGSIPFRKHKGTYIYICTHTCTCLHVYMFIGRVCIHTHTLIYVDLHTCMYVYVNDDTRPRLRKAATPDKRLIPVAIPTRPKGSKIKDPSSQQGPSTEPTVAAWNLWGSILGHDLL